MAGRQNADRPKRGGATRDNQKGWTNFDMATATNQAFMDYYKVRLMLPFRSNIHVLNN